MTTDPRRLNMPLLPLGRHYWSTRYPKVRLGFHSWYNSCVCFISSSLTTPRWGMHGTTTLSTEETNTCIVRLQCCHICFHMHGNWCSHFTQAYICFHPCIKDLAASLWHILSRFLSRYTYSLSCSSEIWQHWARDTDQKDIAVGTEAIFRYRQRVVDCCSAKCFTFLY